MVFEVLGKRDTVGFIFVMVLGLVDRVEESLQSIGDGFQRGLLSDVVVRVELLDCRYNLLYFNNFDVALVTLLDFFGEFWESHHFRKGTFYVLSTANEAQSA